MGVSERLIRHTVLSLSSATKRTGNQRPGSMAVHRVSDTFVSAVRLLCARHRRKGAVTRHRSAGPDSLPKTGTLDLPQAKIT